jgi:hypothetical protein
MWAPSLSRVDGAYYSHARGIDAEGGESVMTYQDLANGFGAGLTAKADWEPTEKDMLATIDLEKLLAVERATVEKGKT